jgi:hypothetical protein
MGETRKTNALNSPVPPEIALHAEPRAKRDIF